MSRHGSSSFVGSGWGTSHLAQKEARKKRLKGGKDPLIGQTLGRCKIQSYIGEGRTAVVYKARHATLRRSVAIKILRPELAEIPEVLSSFEREGKAVARLDHENVLRIYDVGAAKGHHFMILELLRGRDLMGFMKKQPDQRLPADEAAAVLMGAARGLAAAHRNDIVHRDIKPQNLVLDDQGVVRLVDFGLAADIDTESGRVGTPHFMSPEQAKGEPAVGASDVYSLGVTLYYMLVGEPPYAGAKNAGEILKRHIEGRALRPEQHRSDLPNSILQLLRRMTRARPAERPSAEQVVAETEWVLDRVSGGGPAAAVRTRRRRSSAKAGGPGAALWIVLAVVLGGGAFVLLGGGGKDDDAKKTAKAGSGDPGRSKKSATKKKSSGQSDPQEKEEKEPEKLKVDPLMKELEELMLQAENHIREGDYKLAYETLQRAEDKAPSDWEIKTRARKRKASIRRKAFPKKRKLTGVNPEEKKAQEVLREYKDREKELRLNLVLLRGRDVAEEIQTMVKRTAEGTKARAELEKAHRLAGYVRDLLQHCRDRASTLTGEKSSWSHFNSRAEEGIRIKDVERRGLILEYEETEESDLLQWKDISPKIRVRVLDALINKQSAKQNLWLGYYCTLLNNELALVYFRNAKNLEPGETMAQAVREAEK